MVQTHIQIFIKSGERWSNKPTPPSCTKYSISGLFLFLNYTADKYESTFQTTPDFSFSLVMRCKGKGKTCNHVLKKIIPVVRERMAEFTMESKPKLACIMHAKPHKSERIKVSFEGPFTAPSFTYLHDLWPDVHPSVSMSDLNKHDVFYANNVNFPSETRYWR